MGSDEGGDAATRYEEVLSHRALKVAAALRCILARF